MRSRAALTLAAGLAVVLLLHATPAYPNSLQRTLEAARRGEYGLDSSYTGNREKNFVMRQLATSEDRVSLAFSVRPETGFEIRSGKANEVIHLRMDGRKKPIVRIRLFRADDGFRLQFKVADGNKLAKVIKKPKDQMFLPYGVWTDVEVVWLAATAGQRDGSIRIFRNGSSTSFGIRTELDNANHRVEAIYLGQISRPSSSWFGSVYFDDVFLRREP